ncbi:UNVERIFIED_CONTAM: putative serine/threonine-protein kinase [Sesamum radiatum]|uniref:Serine/threonine-protein kinase n=1 Tax=Sesamum radiatum TaxID=300843 RepID=A0AAW2M5H6_SESRA
MGCLCSKRSDTEDFVAENEKEKEKDPSKSSAQVVSPLKKDEVIVGPGDKKNEASLHSRSKTSIESNTSVVPPANAEENSKTRIIERPKNGHRRNSTTELGGAKGMQQPMSRILSMPNGVKGEQVAAGWPSWLSSVAAEAIKGWAPRSADSYEKVNKIGQGTYSSVYMARDLTNDKTVAMKKVRFVKMDPESVRFMAREICILRRLDHPNVMKLDAIVTSRVSGSLYLVFDYMEHDLAGLLASPRVKFTEPQIKCYMKQILSGLEHCHNRGVLHRDIKGSNLLVDNNGILKIGDFGLATTFEPGQNQPLTSRVVTLWYRAPELLLGATEYGPAIDLWSTGCILAELFAGKPIMPGRTEVEQMHKIFKLCGSPTDEYWKKTKLPHASSFKSQRTYKRRVADTFKEFPSSALALVEVLLSIDPEERGTASSALKSEVSFLGFSSSHQILHRAKLLRRKAESVKGHGAEHTRSHSRQQKAVAEGQGQSSKCTSYMYNPQEGSGTGFPIEPPRGNLNNGYSHSNSMIHPNAVGYAYKKIEDDPGLSVPARSLVSFQHRGGLTRQSSQVRQSVADISDYQLKDVGRTSNNDSVGYAPKRNRILFSGPLVPPGGNMDDMLKEHERQIQEAVRKARMSKQNG